MSKVDPLRVYWDSCVFIAFIQGEDGRADVIERLLRDAEEGRLQIVTSALTLVEVSRLPDGPPITDEDDKRLQSYFEHRFIHLVELNRFIAGQARRIARQHGVPNNDAIHVATAIAAKAQRFFTYDEDDLIAKSGQIGDPPLVIQQPVWSGQTDLPLVSG